MNRYLIFEHAIGGHHNVDFVRAATTGDAIRRYIEHHEGDSATFLPDGSLQWGSGCVIYHYPHPLAYIEARYKIYGSWDIRILPEKLDRLDYVESIYCSEDDTGRDMLIEICQPHLRAEFPRSRARAFTWYLTDGRAIVTFYRKIRQFRIEVLRRFLYDYNLRPAVPVWEGDYEEIQNNLLLKWWSDEAILMPCRD
jgi:hypothetical protein